jgi:Na+-transporting NADH:ubiquinone oxidoreductase subunit C
MAKKNEALKTIVVAGVLCIVCSIIVSAIVVTLRPQQKKNAEIDYKKNILLSAGLMEKGADVEEAFEKIETVLVNFETGKIVKSGQIDAVENLKTFDQNKASTDPQRSINIPGSEDVAGLGRRSKFAKVFLTRDQDGKPNTIILNIRSKGLWSTMLGFIALESDAKTIKGFAYYSHGETPGLGGEVDNPSWKKQWIGKSIYDEEFNVEFEVVKGSVNKSASNLMAQYQVDGLSGATITANGVSDSIKYWFGSNAYKKFLSNVRSGDI